MDDGCRIFWFTGLPGAGKSTLARCLRDRLGRSGLAAVLLDGDQLRGALWPLVGYSRPERLELARSYGRLARLLREQGFHVIVATVSLFHEIHDWNREHLPGYFEIFVRADEQTLRQRDQKGLYSRHQQGTQAEVVGLDQQAELPTDPDLILDNGGANTPEETLRPLLDCLTRSRLFGSNG